MIISGAVRDTKTNELLPGVVVALKNTNYGTQTNQDGEFILKNIPQGNYTLIVRLLGYLPIEKNLPLYQDLEFTVGLTPTVYEYKSVEVIAQKKNWALPLSILGLLILISKIKK